MKDIKTICLLIGNLMVRYSVPIRKHPFSTFYRILEALCVQWRNSIHSYIYFEAFFDFISILKYNFRSYKIVNFKDIYPIGAT